MTLGPDFAVGSNNQLRRAAADALKQLIKDAEKEGVTLRLVSGYRSCPTQAAVFAQHVANLGVEEAERQSARPGHSEHQLGTAADIAGPSVGYELTQSFGSTPEGQWLFDNATDYGFVLSYPAGAEAEQITGYLYEPWHWRYLGSPANAAAYNNSGLYLNQWLKQQGN